MKENFLIICLDSVRVHSTGLVDENDNTPFIKQIAENGIEFENCYSPSSWSLPSHVSMFTGAKQPEHNFRPSDVLDPEKTFLEDIPNNYKKYAMSSNPYVTGDFGIRDCFDSVYGIPENIEDKYVEEKEIGTSEPNGFYYADLFKEEVLDSGEPWLAYINLMDAHSPYEPKTKYVEDSEDEDRKIQRELDGKWDIEFYSGKRDRSELKKLQNLYTDAIRQLDDIVRTMINSMDTPTRKNTNIVITGDHGEGFGEKPFDDAPISVGHGFGLYDSLIRVPMVFESAGSNEPRTVSEPATLNNLADLVMGRFEQSNIVEDLKEDIVVAGRGKLQKELVEKWSDWEGLSGYTGPMVFACSLREDGLRKETHWGSKKWVMSDERLTEKSEEAEIPKFRDVDVTISEMTDDTVSSEVEERLEELGYK